MQVHTGTPAELRGREVHFLVEKYFLQALISTLRPGDAFLDVGGDVGLFTIPTAKVVGERGVVLCFEPESVAYRKMLDNLALNGLTNVRVFKKALGDQNSGGRLFVGGTACPSLLPHQGDAEQQSASEAVEVVQGDWLRENENLPIPRAVKIDVDPLV